MKDSYLDLFSSEANLTYKKNPTGKSFNKGIMYLACASGLFTISDNDTLLENIIQHNQQKEVVIKLESYKLAVNDNETLTYTNYINDEAEKVLLNVVETMLNSSDQDFSEIEKHIDENFWDLI